MSELSTFINPTMRQQLAFCKTSVFLIMGVTGLVISTDGMSFLSSLVLQLHSPPPLCLTPAQLGCVAQAWEWCGVSGRLVRCIF